MIKGFLYKAFSFFITRDKKYFLSLVNQRRYEEANLLLKDSKFRKNTSPSDIQEILQALLDGHHFELCIELLKHPSFYRDINLPNLLHSIQSIMDSGVDLPSSFSFLLQLFLDDSTLFPQIPKSNIFPFMHRIAINHPNQIALYLNCAHLNSHLTDSNLCSILDILLSQRKFAKALPSILQLQIIQQRLSSDLLSFYISHLLSLNLTNQVNLLLSNHNLPNRQNIIFNIAKHSICSIDSRSIIYLSTQIQLLKSLPPQQVKKLIKILTFENHQNLTINTSSLSHEGEDAFKRARFHLLSTFLTKTQDLSSIFTSTQLCITLKALIFIFNENRLALQLLNRKDVQSLLNEEDFCGLIHTLASSNYDSITLDILNIKVLADKIPSNTFFIYICDFISQEKFTQAIRLLTNNNLTSKLNLENAIYCKTSLSNLANRNFISAANKKIVNEIVSFLNDIIAIHETKASRSVLKIHENHYPEFSKVLLRFPPIKTHSATILSSAFLNFFAYNTTSIQIQFVPNVVQQSIFSQITDFAYQFFIDASSG
jgi:hypothetical protein